MGYFNRVIIDWTCVSCKREIALPVQFKYGFVNAMATYKNGETVQWNPGSEWPGVDETAWQGPDQKGNMGQPGRANVVVEGWSEDCPECGAEIDEGFLVYLTRDVITDVQPGVADFSKGSFIVVEP